MIRPSNDIRELMAKKQKPKNRKKSVRYRAKLKKKMSKARKRQTRA